MENSRKHSLRAEPSAPGPWGQTPRRTRWGSPRASHTGSPAAPQGSPPNEKQKQLCDHIWAHLPTSPGGSPGAGRGCRLCANQSGCCPDPRWHRTATPTEAPGSGDRAPIAQGSSRPGSFHSSPEKQWTAGPPPSGPVPYRLDSSARVAPGGCPRADKGENAAGKGTKERNEAGGPPGLLGTAGEGVSPHLALRGTQYERPNWGGKEGWEVSTLGGSRDLLMSCLQEGTPGTSQMRDPKSTTRIPARW